MQIFPAHDMGDNEAENWGEREKCWKEGQLGLQTKAAGSYSPNK